MKPFRQPLVAAFAVLSTVIAPAVSSACTGITITPKDGSVIFGRTLEFAQDIKSNIIIVPRNRDFVGTTPADGPGLHWKTKYGAVGMNSFGLPMFADGLNEKGLHVGIFYFPGYGKYQAVTEKDYDRTLAPHEFAGFLLGVCGSVEEAVTAAKAVRVGEVVLDAFGFVPPFHFIVNDGSGKSAVLEYVAGELKIHDNPLGVITNSPTFDWHMTNLANYVNLTVSNVPKLDVDGLALRALGQGSGMLGLPGDFTPPSRFVRAVAFSKSALPVETARDGVLQTFHILNQFDIPQGAARGSEHGKPVADYTLWTAVADLRHLRYYYRTHQNSRIRVIDLRAADLGAADVKSISIGGDEQIEDQTATAK
jgi:choloylglycine hydrolase